MRVKIIISALLLTLASMACAPSGPTPPREDNFAFIFREVPCGTTPLHVYDSARDQLVYTPIGETTPITISLELTDEELESIYQKALLIGFFNFPPKIIAPQNAVRMISAPSGSYSLSITNGDLTNSTSWSSEIITDPLFEEAARFMELVVLIRNTFESKPEYKLLPEPRAGCV